MFGVSPQIIFLFLCIPIRTFLAYIMYSNLWNLQNKLATFLLAIGIGIITIWLFDLRPTGPEANGDIWWNDSRPLHGLLWIFSSWLYFNGHSTHASFILLSDVIYGILNSYLHYS